MVNIPRLRIGLHVGQLLQSVPGGIGRVTEMLCDELPKHTDVVAFAAGLRHATPALRSRLDAAVERRNLGVGSAHWHYELWQRNRWRRIDLGVDVCHAPSLAIPPISAPLVVTINDVAFLRHPHAFTRHGIRFHERGLATARREAAAIIVPSMFTRNELIREGFDPGRIHHVPLAVPTPDPRPPEASCQRLRRLRVVGPYLLVAGTVEPRKDHASVVAAFEHVRAHRPDLSLVVAGARGWLPAVVAPSLARPGVIECGHVSDADLDLLYWHAEIVVNASKYEGFGLTVLEAMARGCPVIATNIPPHVELVGDAAWLFPPGDVGMLAAEINALLDDPARRSHLGRAALRRSTTFDIDTTVQGHLAAYATVNRSRGDARLM